LKLDRIKEDEIRHACSTREEEQNIFHNRSQPVYWADVYRERRYEMLCEYNFSSLRWAC